MELIEQYRNDPDYHAKCPLYTEDKRYVWSPVQILSYNPSTSKYVVRVMKNGAVKFVGRLSLMLKNEDESTFKSRLKQCKQLQKQVEEDVRFLKYLKSIDDSVVSDLPQWQRVNIVKRLGNSPHKSIVALKNQLMQQVESEYRLNMKKIYVLRQMEDPQNARKFIELRLTTRSLNDFG